MNSNGNDNVVVIVRRPNESVNRPTKCFDTREVGVVQLGTGSYDVTATVMRSADLFEWTPATVDPVSAVAGTDGTELITVRLAEPSGLCRRLSGRRTPSFRSARGGRWRDGTSIRDRAGRGKR